MNGAKITLTERDAAHGLIAQRDFGVERGRIHEQAQIATARFDARDAAEGLDDSGKHRAIVAATGASRRRSGAGRAGHG